MSWLAPVGSDPGHRSARAHVGSGTEQVWNRFLPKLRYNADVPCRPCL